VVGLGAGTLAAYARPGDELVFYDIDPKIEAVARRHFTYLADARGKVRVEVADGRRALEASAADYDLIVIDAFMGDGVPAHLLTREALEIYQSRLKARDGVLVVHATLRYSQLYPVVAATARTVGWESMEVTTDIRESLADRDWDPARSSYILAGSFSRAKEWSGWYPLEEDNERVKRKVTTLSSVIAGPRNTWTDDRAAALDTLDLSLWLSR
jgi:spermidine synthase